MHDVILLVAQHLGPRDDVRMTEAGTSITHEHSVTELVFYSRSSREGAEPLTIPVVETRFASGSVPAFSSEQIARLNRRSVYGHFYLHDGQLRCRLALSLREQGPDAAWIARYLVTAFLTQGPLGFRTARAETSRTEFLTARADLAAPRQWTTPIPDLVFEEVAQILGDEGEVARARPGGLYIALALDGMGMLRGGDEAAIDVTTTIEHPLAGTGYLATLTLPTLQPWLSGDARCEILNALEFKKEDFVPRLGSWALRGGGGGAEIVYGLFVPTQEGSTKLLVQIVRWMIERARWIQDVHWEPGIGLSFQDDAA